MNLSCSAVAVMMQPSCGLCDQQLGNELQKCNQCLRFFCQMNQCIAFLTYVLNLCCTFCVWHFSWSCQRRLHGQPVWCHLIFILCLSVCVLLKSKCPSSALVVGPSSHASHAQGTSFYICKRLQFACNCFENSASYQETAFKFGRCCLVKLHRYVTDEIASAK